MRKRSTHLLGRAKAEHTAALSPAPGHSAIIFTGPLAKAHATRARCAACEDARFVRLGRRRRRCSCPSDRDPARVRAAVPTATARPGQPAAANPTQLSVRQRKGRRAGAPSRILASCRPAGHGLCPGRLVCNNKSGERSVGRGDHPCCYPASCVDLWLARKGNGEIFQISAT